ncbi:FAD-linked sulfhydryl oxidase ALR-like [Teleopsis dalmanni]|uniref:FAD-linked sulfhydryl oxidase ALR-like n=1 Tax=Teleopsis dalmanni TaxID=139649 RepID=UPI0018CF4483|nr:FAD-linked sulfhydryl oxidase ALR-like [Teleopsis dalmanni]
MFKFAKLSNKNIYNAMYNAMRTCTQAIPDKDPKQIQEPRNLREDCPMNKAKMGLAAWSIMHSFAAYYPERPTAFQKRMARNFYEAIPHMYPCVTCCTDYLKYLESNPVQVSSRFDLNMWLCIFHNAVNKKLGKPEYDCSKVAERWKDGWLDGSCDQE